MHFLGLFLHPWNWLYWTFRSSNLICGAFLDPLYIEWVEVDLDHEKVVAQLGLPRSRPEPVVHHGLVLKYLRIFCYLFHRIQGACVMDHGKGFVEHIVNHTSHPVLAKYCSEGQMASEFCVMYSVCSHSTAQLHSRSPFGEVTHLLYFNTNKFRIISHYSLKILIVKWTTHQLSSLVQAVYDIVHASCILGYEGLKCFNWKW